MPASGLAVTDDHMSENDPSENEQGEQAGKAHEQLPTVEVENPPAPGEVENALAVDYGAVRVPDSKPYDEFNYAERRSCLLKRIERAGHPKALPQTYAEMGDEFGVSKATIHRDLKILAEWTAQNLDREHVHILDSVFRGAIMDLVDEGKYAWATEVGKEWFDWLADMGVVERVPDRLDLDATVRQAPTETDEYEIIPDDEAEALAVESEAENAEH